jgi:hypothetical protein
MAWLQAAGRLSGKALHVALAIWFVRGCEGASEVPVRPSILAGFGVSRFAGYRALNALEDAGLVRVDRRRGRAARVTLLGVADEDVSRAPD